MIVIYLIICIMIVNTEGIFPGRTSSTVDSNTMNIYANLLKTIVKVNEERVEAIRKIASLQDYILTKNTLKIDDYYDSLETHDSAPNIVDPPKLRRSGDESSLNKRFFTI